MSNYHPEQTELAAQFGHGGSDFYSMYNFVERINGDYYTIMGLPVCRLATILRQLAPEITEDHQ